MYNKEVFSLLVVIKVLRGVPEGNNTSYEDKYSSEKKKKNPPKKTVQ